MAALSLGTPSNWLLDQWNSLAVEKDIKKPRMDYRKVRLIIILRTNIYCQAKVLGAIYALPDLILTRTFGNRY